MIGAEVLKSNFRTRGLWPLAERQL
jgi:hypothetical protein